MEAAVFLCDISSLPGAERAFIEAHALARLKTILWLLAPYRDLQIIIAECLLCTLHRLCDAYSHYRCAVWCCNAGFPLLPTVAARRVWLSPTAASPHLYCSCRLSCGFTVSFTWGLGGLRS